MVTVPPEVIASWPPPNFVDPQTRGPAQTVLSPVILALGTIAVGARLYSRVFVRKWIGADDVLVTVGLVCFSVSQSIVLCALTLRVWRYRDMSLIFVVH